MTGPPRPFFNLVKARRKMLQTSAAILIGSDDFENRLHRLARIEVRVDIGEPARIAHRSTSTGTDSP